MVENGTLSVNKPDMAVERDKRIVALRDQGWTFNDISRDLGISVGYVNILYYQNCAKPGDEDVPDVMSVTTAREVKALLGVWPSPATAEEVARRAMDLFRMCRRRRTRGEVTQWLESRGLGWGHPAGWKP